MCISVPGSRKKSAALNLLVEVSKGFTRWNTGTSAEGLLRLTCLHITMRFIVTNT